MSEKQELRKQLIEGFRNEGWGTGDCEPPCNCRGCYDAQNALASIALKVFTPLLLAHTEAMVKAVEGLEVFTSYSDYDEGGVIDLEGGLEQEAKGNNAGQAFGLGDERLVDLSEVISAIRKAGGE